MRNSKSTFSTLGASSHGNEEREINDYYATDPKATQQLVDLVELDKNILEPACGGGHISEVLIDRGFNVISEDLFDRGYGESGKDFLLRTEPFNGDVVTNPPYKCAQAFAEKSLELIPEGNKVCMFLKIQFLESTSRAQFLKENPPKYVYVASDRINCAKGGDFENLERSAVCYCWFIWEKGFKGDPSIRWFNYKKK